MANETFDQVYSSIKYGKMQEVAEYLDNGGDPNLTNRNGWSLLMSAAFKGNSRILILLLEHGATLEACNKTNETALTLAANQGNVKCVKVLLAYGARIPINFDLEGLKHYATQQAVQYFGQTSAKVSELIEVVHLMKEAGAV